MAHEYIDHRLSVLPRILLSRRHYSPLCPVVFSLLVEQSRYRRVDGERGIMASSDFRRLRVTIAPCQGVLGGGGRNRTGVHGFAGRCMTTLPPRRVESRADKTARRHKLRGRALALPRESGAGKESRTPDLNLGKVALYQLSYSRVGQL